MLTFNMARIALVFTLAVMVVVDVCFLPAPMGFSNWFYALPIALFLAFTAWGSSFIGSNFHIETICRANTIEKVVALTFDDGPSGATTDQILNVLKKSNVEATFFCIGRNISENKQQAKKITEEGHIIGNHTFNHGNFIDFYGKKKLAQELSDTDKMVKEICGVVPRLFRPPYGVTTPALAAVLKEKGYKVVGWSIRSMDTMVKTKEALIKNIGEVKPGDIILFHDNVVLTAQVLENYINELKSNNFKILRVDKMLNISPYV